jgi:hypothetical protein
MPTETTQRPGGRRERRKYWSSVHRDLRPSLLVPEVAGMPKAVREAAKRAREAYSRYEEAKLDFEDARDEERNAPKIDEAADAKALEAGEELPEPTLPAKRKALAEANRRKQAAEQGLVAALEAQADAIKDEHGTWTATQEERIGKRTAAIRELLDQLAEEFAGLSLERRIARALDEFAPGCRVDGWNLSQRWPEEEAKRRERERQKIESHRRLRPADPVEFKTPSLLAALGILVDDGPTESKRP